MEARQIIKLFGGVRPMARTLGHARHTTVQGWGNRNAIPSRHQSEILAFARRLSLGLTADDLIAAASDLNVFKTPVSESAA